MVHTGARVAKERVERAGMALKVVRDTNASTAQGLHVLPPAHLPVIKAKVGKARAVTIRAASNHHHRSITLILEMTRMVSTVTVLLLDWDLPTILLAVTQWRGRITYKRCRYSP